MGHEREGGTTVNFLRSFDTNLPNLLGKLGQLVSVDTPSDDPAASALALAGVARDLSALGARCRRLGAEDILLAEAEGEGAGTVLLLGHIDTVFEHGEAATRPFFMEGNRAFGPGVADMKGGVVLAAGVLEALRAAGSPFGSLRILFTGDEEIGAPRSRDEILQAAKGCDAVLVLEPGRPGGEVVSARKGVGTFQLHALGRAAHAGVEPEKGRSAVAEMARRIAAISDLNGQLPGATFNVGVVAGGTRPNVVAGEAHCEIDVRIARQQDAETALGLLRAAGLQPCDTDVSLQLEGEFASPPMEKGEGTVWLLGHAQAAAAQLGLKIQDIPTGGGSDGNRIAAAGIPVLDALGPVGGRAHSVEEYLEIPSIPQRGALIAAMVAAISREREAAEGSKRSKDAQES